MATQEILLQYKADITDLQAKVAVIGQKSRQVSQSVKTAQESAGTGFKNLGNALAPLGAAIASAFAVSQVISFGKESVHAFEQAELSARKLQSAISAQGGIQADFDELLAQSKELQKTTIFSDEAIQGAQTLALQFGLTGDAVKELTPLIIDFASATGQDLNSAMSSVLRGLEGQGRGLKLYGINVDAAGSRAENLAKIQDQLSTKFKGQAEAIGKTSVGTLQRLGNAYDELKEKIGAFLIPAVEGFAKLADAALKFTETPISEELQQEQIDLVAVGLRIEDVNTSNEDRIKLINELKSKYPEYLNNVKADKVTNEELSVILQKVNSDLINRIVLQKATEQAQAAAAKQQSAIEGQAEAELDLRRQLVITSQAYKVEINKSLPLLKQVEDLVSRIKLKDPSFDAESIQLLAAQVGTTQTKVNEKTKEANTLEEERIKLAKELNIELGKTPEEKKGAAFVKPESDVDIKKRQESEKKASDEAKKQAEDAAKFIEELNNRTSAANIANIKDETDAKKAELQKQFEDNIAFIEKGFQQGFISRENAAANIKFFEEKLIEARLNLDEKAAQEEFKLQQEKNKKLAEDAFAQQSATNDLLEAQEIAAIEASYAKQTDHSTAAEEKKNQEVLKVKIKFLEAEKKRHEDEPIVIANINKQILALNNDLNNSLFKSDKEAAEARIKLIQDVNCRYW